MAQINPIYILLEGYKHKVKQFQHRLKKINAMPDGAEKTQARQKYNEDLKNFQQKRVERLGQHMANYRMNHIIDHNEKMKSNPYYAQGKERAYNVAGQDQLDAQGLLDRKDRKIADKRSGLIHDKHWRRLRQQARELDKMRYGENTKGLKKKSGIQWDQNYGYDIENGKAERKKYADFLRSSLKDSADRKIGGWQGVKNIFTGEGGTANDTAWKVNYLANAVNGTGDTFINSISVPLTGIPLGKAPLIGLNLSHLLKSRVSTDPKVVNYIRNGNYDKARAELIQKRTEAENNGDLDSYKKIDEDIKSLVRWKNTQNVGNHKKGLLNKIITVGQESDINQMGHSPSNSSQLLNLADRDISRRPVSTEFKNDPATKKYTDQIQKCVATAMAFQENGQTDQAMKYLSMAERLNNRFNSRSNISKRIRGINLLRAVDDTPADLRNDGNRLSDIASAAPQQIDDLIQRAKNGVKKGVSLAKDNAVVNFVKNSKPIAKIGQYVQPVAQVIRQNLPGSGIVDHVAKAGKEVGKLAYNVVTDPTMLANVTGGGIGDMVNPTGFVKKIINPKSIIHTANSGIPYLVARRDIQKRIDNGELPPEALNRLNAVFAQQASDDFNTPWGNTSRAVGRVINGQGTIPTRIVNGVKQFADETMQ